MEGVPPAARLRPARFLAIFIASGAALFCAYFLRDNHIEPTDPKRSHGVNDTPGQPMVLSLGLPCKNPCYLTKTLTPDAFAVFN